MNLAAYRLGVVNVFFAMATVVVLRSWADALFLATYGARWLPHYLVAATIAYVVVSTAYGAIVRRLRPAALDALVDAALAMAALAAPWAAGRGGAGPFAAAVTTLALASIANLAAWNAVASTVSGRAARRYLPRAGAAATAGATVAGFVTSGLVARLGVDRLPWIAAGLAALLLVCGLLVHRHAATATPGAAAPRVPAARPPAGAPLSPATRRLVAWLSAAAIAEAATSALVDFGFKAGLAASHGRDEIGVFVAAFQGVTNAGVLLLQFFLVPRLLATRSLTFSFSLHPAALAAVAAVWVAWPSLACAAAGRGLDAVLKHSASRASQEVALSPLPRLDQARWKIFLRGGATQLGAAAAGLALILGGPSVARAPWALAGVTCLVAAAWSLAVRRAARAYLTALAAALGVRRLLLDEERVSGAALDREGFARLVDLTAHADAAVRRFGRAMLARTVARAHELVPHFSHPSPAARSALFWVAARRPDRAAGAALGEAVRRERDPDALAEGLAALAAHDDVGAVEAARARLGDGGGRDAAAAAAYLAQLGELAPAEAWAVVRATLDVDGRRAAAIARRERERGRPLAELEAELSRRTSSVDAATRREAFHAVAALAGLVPAAPLLEALGAGDPAAQAAVAAADGAALRRLAGEARRDGSIRTRVRLARALRASDAAETGPILIELLGDDDPHAREAAARTLAKHVRDRRAVVPRPAVDRALDRELELLAAYVAARAPADVRPAFHEEELRRQLLLCLGRVLGIAALGGNPATVHAAERRLRSDVDRDRRGALDLLQEVARGARRRRLLALVERAIAPPAGPPGPEATAALVALDPWLARVLGGELDATAPRFAALRSTPLFEDVPGEALAPLCAVAAELDVAPGEVVVHQGDPGDALFVVLAGELRMDVGGRDIGALGPGAAFGELALIDGAPRSSTVRAVTPSRLLRLERAAFQEALDRGPEVGLGLLGSLARWLRGGAPSARPLDAAGAAAVPDMMAQRGSR